MDTSPSPARPAARSILPLAIAAGALVLFLATLNHWVTLGSLGLSAQVLGWDWWNPQIGRPLFRLLTWPVTALPAGWQLVALNAFSALCAALTLALLARSVALLPQDRTQSQRSRLRDDTALLGGGMSWLPPLLAALVCGLQLTFWESATVATGEMLNLLLFAWCVRCLLEFRHSRRDPWLYGFALGLGLGVANNWAMLGFTPLFLIALIWIRGTDLWRGPLLARLFLWAAAGASLYFVNPLIAVIQGGSESSFWELVRFELGSQKNQLLQYPKGRALLLSLTSCVPLLLAGIRWPSGFGDVSASGAWLSDLLFRVIHAVILTACLWVAFDPAFSPRALGYGLPLLTFYFLGALASGYFSGYFLVLWGPEEEKSWRKPGPFTRALQRTCLGVIGLLPIVIPLLLVRQNYPILREQNGPALRQYAENLAAGLPDAGGIGVSESPAPLQLVAALQAGRANPSLLLDSRWLPSPSYHRKLARRDGDRWFKVDGLPLTGAVAPAATIQWLGQLSGSNTVVALDPPDGTLFLEQFFRVPTGITAALLPYPENVIQAPSLTLAHIKRIDAIWAAPGMAAQLATLSQSTNGATDVRTLRGIYSAALNNWGVELQRAGQLPQAAERFRHAAALDTNNAVALLNLDFNESLRSGQPPTLDPARVAQDLLLQHRTWRAVITAHGLPDEPTLAFALGRVFRQAGLARQAIEQLARAALHHPTNLAVQFSLADACLGARLPELAQATMRQLRARPELITTASEPELVRLEALAFFQQNNTLQAETLLLAARQKFPQNVPLLEALAETYLFSRRFTNAQEVLEAQLALAPNNTRVLLNLGGALIQMQAFERALVPLGRLHDLHPTHGGALLNRAIAFMNLNRTDEAQRDYQALLKLAPRLHNAHVGLAEVAEKRNRPADAIRHFEEALTLMPPEHPDLGRIRERLAKLKGSPVK